MTKLKSKDKGYLSVQARIKTMASASVSVRPQARPKPKPKALAKDRARDKVEARVGAIVKVQNQCLLSLKMLLGMVRWELLRQMELNMGLWVHKVAICRHMLCLIELNMELKVLWAHL